MNFKPSKKQIVGVVILAIFIFTNPTLKAFKDYLGVPSIGIKRISFRRTFNGFIFSIYEANGSGESTRCIAMLGNFISI